MTRTGWLGVAAVALLAAGFAYLNQGETAAVHLGVTSLFQVPVSLLVLGAFLLGMIAMFLVGLRHDLRVRRLLREREVVAPRGDDRTEVYPHGYPPPDLS